MAKRASVDEEPFRPLNAAVLNSVMRHRPEAGRGAEGTELGANLVERSGTEGASSNGTVLPKSTVVSPLMQRLDQEKRILFTREETQALDWLVNKLAARLRTQVKTSHVVRALTSLLLRAEAQLDQRAGEHGALIRPANGDFVGLQRFERELSVILAHALRDAGLPRM